MLVRHRANGLADLGIGERQHPVAQRLVDRRQAIETQEADDEAQCRAVDEQREQHEAGGEHRDEPLDLRLQRRVLRDGQRQHQGQGAAQAAPGDGELVGGADRLGELGQAQQRQEQEQHQEARGEHSHDQRREQHDIVELHVEQQLRHQNGSQHEHQRMRPEGDLRPEIGDERPVVGGDARPPGGADGQSGAEHRDDARNMHDLFGGDEDEIGKRDGQRRFGQPIVARPGDELQQRPPAPGSPEPRRRRRRPGTAPRQRAGSAVVRRRSRRAAP